MSISVCQINSSNKMMRSRSSSPRCRTKICSLTRWLQP